MMMLLCVLVEPIRYDFVAPAKVGSEMVMIRYTDGQAPRTIFRRHNAILAKPFAELHFQYSDIFIDRTINYLKTRLLVPDLVVTSEGRNLDDLKIEASVIDTDGKLLFTLAIPHPKDGYPCFGWIGGRTPTIAVELDDGDVVIYTRYGKHLRRRETVAKLFDVPAWRMQAANIQEPLGVDTPYQDTAQKLPDWPSRASAFMDPPEGITLLWTYSRIACNWNGKKAYYSPPAGVHYGYPRPMKYPWIVARRVFPQNIPPEELIMPLQDPYLDSRLYLINMISGLEEELGQGIYAISLLRGGRK